MAWRRNRKTHYVFGRRWKDIILAYAATWCFPYVIPFLSNEVLFSNVLSIVVFCLILHLFDKIRSCSRCVYVAGGLYSAILVVGAQISEKRILPLGSVAFYISILIYTIVLARLIEALFRLCIKSKEENGDGDINKSSVRNNLKTGVKIWILLFAAWFPIWLALYPGAFAYDAQAAFLQVTENKLTATHPVLHTLILGNMVEKIGTMAGDYNIGIALYCLTQMFVAAGVFSYVCLFLKREKSSEKVIKFTFLWYAFFPVISISVGCTTKDVFFTLAALTSIVMSYSILEHHSAEGHLVAGEIVLTIINFLFVILRPSAVYIFTVFMVMLILYSPIKMKKLFAMSFMLVGCLHLIYTGPFYSLLDVQPADKRAAFSVPVQQLARVYYEQGEMDEEDKQILSEILPLEVIQKRYSPRLADPMNGSFNLRQFNQNRERYIKLYISLLKKNPNLFMSSFLDNTLAYWYPGTLVDGYTVYYQQYKIDSYSLYKNSSYFAPITEEPGIRKSKIPWLEKIIKDMTLNFKQGKLPIVALIFSPGMIFVLLLFAWLLNIKKKRYNRVLSLNFVVLIVCACFIGPIALVRYCLILFYSVPILLHWILE